MLSYRNYINCQIKRADASTNEWTVLSNEELRPRVPRHERFIHDRDVLPTSLMQAVRAACKDKDEIRVALSGSGVAAGLLVDEAFWDVYCSIDVQVLIDSCDAAVNDFAKELASQLRVMMPATARYSEGHDPDNRDIIILVVRNVSFYIYCVDSIDPSEVITAHASSFEKICWLNDDSLERERGLFMSQSWLDAYQSQSLIVDPDHTVMIMQQAATAALHCGYELWLADFEYDLFVHRHLLSQTVLHDHTGMQVQATAHSLPPESMIFHCMQLHVRDNVWRRRRIYVTDIQFRDLPLSFTHRNVMRELYPSFSKKYWHNRSFAAHNHAALSFSVVNHASVRWHGAAARMDGSAFHVHIDANDANVFDLSHLVFPQQCFEPVTILIACGHTTDPMDIDIRGINADHVRVVSGIREATLRIIDSSVVKLDVDTNHVTHAICHLVLHRMPRLELLVLPETEVPRKRTIVTIGETVNPAVQLCAVTSRVSTIIESSIARHSVIAIPRLHRTYLLQRSTTTLAHQWESISREFWSVVTHPRRIDAGWLLHAIDVMRHLARGGTSFVVPRVRDPVSVGDETRVVVSARGMMHYEHLRRYFTITRADRTTDNFRRTRFARDPVTRRMIVHVVADASSAARFFRSSPHIGNMHRLLTEFIAGPSNSQN